MNKKLFAIPFTDKRDRKHVVAVRATTPEEALELLAAFQEGYEGFLWGVPELREVVEIEPDESYPVQVLWHEDYD